MAKVFITGSADGLGALCARSLISQGHEVVLHARNASRARDTLTKVAGAKAILTGDLSDMDQTMKLAEEINASGPFDAVIHNAGVYQVSAPLIFSVNTIAPYILTCLVQRPKRIIYLSSGMHLQGRPNFEHFRMDTNRITYSDSKLHVLMLSMAVARKWRDVFSNGVDPGWVPTKMGGRGAPDDLQKGYETQAWLAVSDDARAMVTGRYFFHKQERPCNPLAGDNALQDRLLELCADLTNVAFPG